MRASVVLAALVATATTLQTAGGVAAGVDGAVAPGVALPVRPETCSARDATALRNAELHAAGGRDVCALAQQRGRSELQPRLQSRALLSCSRAALGRASLCTEWRVRCARAPHRAMPCCTPWQPPCKVHHCSAHRSGMTSPDRAFAPCALSTGRDAARGEYLCACVDRGGAADSEWERTWSSACDGDAPCRSPDGVIGTMLDGRVCVTRHGAAGSFQQLCLPGAAAPRAGS